MNEPLNPCPFCNTTPILQHTPETGFYIHCPTCQSYTHGVQWSREEALAVWNNRPDPWVRIDPERPESLPEKNGFECLLSIHITDDPFTDDYDEVVPAYSNNGMWEVDGPYGEIEPLERVMGRGSRRVTAVAWQPWPAPYPNEEG